MRSGSKSPEIVLNDVTAGHESIYQSSCGSSKIFPELSYARSRISNCTLVHVNERDARNLIKRERDDEVIRD